MRLAAPIIVTSITCLLSACTKVEHLRQDAESGKARSELALGYAYENGTYGLQRDYGSAKKWYEASAGQGEPYADCALGSLYHRGLGVPVDNETAVKWYLKAHADGAASHAGEADSVADATASQTAYATHESAGKKLEPLLRAALSGDTSVLHDVGKIDLRLGRELSMTLQF
jgi:TPR repeat protein